MRKIKNVQRYANISDIPFDQRSLIHQEAWFPPCFVRQNQQKKLFFLARRFQTTFTQQCSNMRPLVSSTFPQGFRISKKFGDWTSGNRPTRGLEKTDIFGYRRTLRLIERIGLGADSCKKPGAVSDPQSIGKQCSFIETLFI